MQRCAAIAVTGVQVSFGGGQAVNFGNIAFLGGRMKAAISRHFCSAGRDLRHGRAT